MPFSRIVNRVQSVSYTHLVDACAEPTAQLLAALFREAAGENALQGAALERFGYFLGRWIYLMDAADDLLEDLKEGAFNPFVSRLGLSGKTCLLYTSRCV